MKKKIVIELLFNKKKKKLAKQFVDEEFITIW
jgi:hypothetical protein